VQVRVSTYVSTVFALVIAANRLGVYVVTWS
jgi:hypothetical protein